MPKIETLSLASCDPEAQREFYLKVLGMQEFTGKRVGYSDEEAKLFFPKATEPYHSTPNDLYWKIAIAVPNIELACEQLAAKGIVVGSPRQFQDIGYLTHFTDPEGFTIELIEHWFEGNRGAEIVDPDLLGGGPHLNLITLRTMDINAVQQSCDSWGMKPLSIQPVESHSFTLYFFAFTTDIPPSPDLYSVENREWLYQRRYTILEFQHVHNASSITQPKTGGAEYAGIEFSDFKNEGHSTELIFNASE